MLRMSPFKIESPTTGHEVVVLLHKYGDRARLCAGGTDLLPNIKHELHSPEILINLSMVQELKEVALDGEYLIIGAGVTIDELSKNKVIAYAAPGLAAAARHIAGPQLRRMGTIGGNICLDTRCLYYNQSYFWRESLGFCLKKGGTVCHVTQTGKRCVAATSNDLVTMLTSLDAQVEMNSVSGSRSIDIRKFYRGDGQNYTVLEEGELLTNVRVKLNEAVGIKRFEGFAKLRHRASIDYPILSVGVCFWVSEELEILKAALTVNALAAKPRFFDAAFLEGAKFGSESFDALADFAQAKCHPLTNICDDPEWRKEMVGVYVRKACLTSSAAINA